MPIYEFQCQNCGTRFEVLAATGSDSAVCASCGMDRTRRVLSPVSPPSRQPRGSRVRDSESRRREREASRGERLADARKKRQRGELP